MPRSVKGRVKRRLPSLLGRLDARDPRRPRNRPRQYRTRSFLLADLMRWMSTGRQ